MTATDWKCRWHTEGVLSLIRPAAAEIEQQIAAAARLPVFAPHLLAPETGLLAGANLPFGFVHDRSQSVIGEGPAAFDAAKRAFVRWDMFNLGWAHVANADAVIAAGQMIAVEFQTLRLWTLNLSRIIQVVDTPDRFGFTYATTAIHVEQGEERFLIEFDPRTAQVCYALEAVSRPRAAFARVAFPVARFFQRRFVRESHQRMRREAVAG